VNSSLKIRFPTGGGGARVAMGGKVAEYVVGVTVGGNQMIVGVLEGTEVRLESTSGVIAWLGREREQADNIRDDSRHRERASDRGFLRQDSGIQVNQL